MPSHLGHGMHVPYLDRGPKALSDYHTITNLPFEVKPKLSTRYDLMHRPSSVNLPMLLKHENADSPRASVLGFSELSEPIVDDDKRFEIDYAKFLKDHERTLGPDGFLDSHRYSHALTVRSLNSSPRLTQAFRQYKEPTTVVALTNRIAADQREFDKRMKIIEDHMWQHKQEERELKRVDGDVNKKKRAVQRTLRELENNSNKKILEEEKWLNESIKKSKRVGSNAIHDKEKRTKERISKAHSDLQQFKDKMRKNALVVSESEQQYRQKLTELELKKSQMQNLSHDFEERLKRKETEMRNLAKELAHLSIQMNLESMVGRVSDVEFKRQERVQAQKYINENKEHQAALDKKLSKFEGVNRASENRRRQVSATLSSKKAHLLERGREGDRRVTDNRNQVEDNIATQKKLQEVAEAAKLDKQKKDYQRNVQAHVVRKNVGLRKSQSARHKNYEDRRDNWEKTFDKNHRDFARKRNDSLLRTFTRIVQHDNDTEHQLFQRCKREEYNRKSLEQTLHKLQKQLVSAKARNTSKIRETISETERREKNLEKKVMLTQAKLAQAQNDRSMAEWLLRKYRGAAKETQHVYNEIVKENKHLAKVAARTETYLEQQAVPTM